MKSAEEDRNRGIRICSPLYKRRWTSSSPVCKEVNLLYVELREIHTRQPMAIITPPILELQIEEWKRGSILKNVVIGYISTE